MHWGRAWTGLTEKVHAPLSHVFSCFGRGMKYNRQCNHKKAIRVLEKVKPHTLGTQDRLRFHSVLAECYLKLGHYDKAADNYREALRLAPGDDDLQALIEQCHVMKKEFQVSMRLSVEEVQNLPSATPCTAGGQARTHRVAPPKRTFSFGLGHNIWRLMASAACTIIIALLLQPFTGKDGLQDSASKANTGSSAVVRKNVVTANRLAPTRGAVVVGPSVHVSSAASIKSRSMVRRHRVGRNSGYTKSTRRVNYAAVHPTDTIHFE